jgi:hypothetical protein
MSGGRFNYKQYCIGDIADCIVMEIARAKRPLPPPTIRKWVTCKIKIGKNSFSYDGSYWRRFESIDEVKEYFSRLGGTKILSEETLPNGESQITIHFKRTNEKRIFTSYTEEVYLDELGREIYQPEYSEQTIKEFKNAIRILRMAQVYAQRVDWLICGDDGEESFHERLAEDLANITDEQIEKDIQEQINYLINDGD